jgi:flagellar basal body-associated protein FliL
MGRRIAVSSSAHSVIIIIIIIIYLLTAIGLSPGGSTHLHTNNTQNNTNNKRKTQITNNVEECGPCPVFASFYPGICTLQLRKKHGKTTVRVRETSFRLIKTSVRVQYT